jgi:hypothetical protein
MSVPTLTDVKAQLKITGGDQDDLLTTYLNAALRLIEARVGPSSVRAFTESITTRGAGFNLSYRPIVEITTITSQRDGYFAPDVSLLAFDSKTGAVWATDNSTLVGSWEVAYTAGWTTFPDNYHLATLVTVQHLFRTTRGGSKRPSMGNTDDLQVTFGHTLARGVRGQSVQLPAAALELLADGEGIYFGGIA